MLTNIVEAGNDNNIPMIYWDIIDVCQYKCSYCYNMKLIEQEEYKLGLHQQAWKLALNKLQKLNFDFNIAVHGGEPTLHPELSNIINELEAMEHCRSIVLSTNITAADETYKQFDTPGSKVSIHFSYHPQYHKKIFDKLQRIVNSIEHIKVWAEAILYPKQEYYEQMLEFITKVKDAGITLHISQANNTKEWLEPEDEGFSDIFGVYLRESKGANSFKHITNTGDTVYVTEYDIMENDIHYHNWQCQALSYTIGVNGEIVNNCTRKRLPILIKESDVKKFVTCPQSTHCYCSEMFNYKKFKNVKFTKSN